MNGTSMLEKYRHDWWGKDTDEYYQYPSLDEALLASLEEEMEEQEMPRLDKISGIFSFGGGDSRGSHFSMVIRDAADAQDWLEGCAQSDWGVKSCAKSTPSYLEERYYECVMEGDYESFDPYELEKSSAGTISRVFYRAAKAYKAAWAREDDDSMGRIANTFYRRFQRAVRHLPGQMYGPLTNYADYDVTVVNGVVTDVRIARKYSAPSS